jgi:hypothetical protein
MQRRSELAIIRGLQTVFAFFEDDLRERDSEAAERGSHRREIGKRTLGGNGHQLRDGLTAVGDHNLSACANLIEHARQLSREIADFNASHRRLMRTEFARLSRAHAALPRASRADTPARFA